MFIISQLVQTMAPEMGVGIGIGKELIVASGIIDALAIFFE